ncbi:Mal regulon transcriptional regulator MalI [Mixta tenebrionis]|uniref:Mal regulon transcriptional regulator MalI n=1 Tax=Mixta tenebrionis TaxID=2562439 RepID=A0A506V589_9GAMM|nr:MULTISPECIES: Mal regulon transcriptional regulator MalI [Mixta]QHM77938.1 Maltose regulon regulatory protein MalI [Mixta theicola]TPW40855.1 Mal regulon transcriptional regulator MalI [Mixta tenebrionis]
MRKVGIIDVAKAAGVSVSTVSLVLRQKGKISAQTIARVQAAIADLGYVHNVAAANLRASTSNLIGLIVSDLSDTFTLKVMTHLVQALEQQGYMTLLAHPQDEETQLAQCLLAFNRQGVAGVIFLNANPRRQTLPEALRQSPLPQVVVSQTQINDPCDLVMRDNRQAAALATRYLIGRGHRNIGYIGGEAGSLIREQRLAGYRLALQQHGLPLRAEWTPACAEETDAARLASRRLLESNNKITALLCHSAHAIIGCLSGIYQTGRTVGKDVFLTQQVSLVGFEDMLQINLSSPAFTYVSSASEEAGRQAAAVIIGKLRQPCLTPQRITLSGELVLRESG